jgi:hypothetical protein
MLRKCMESESKERHAIARKGVTWNEIARKGNSWHGKERPSLTRKGLV